MLLITTCVKVRLSVSPYSMSRTSHLCGHDSYYQPTNSDREGYLCVYWYTCRLSRLGIVCTGYCCPTSHIRQDIKPGTSGYIFYGVMYQCDTFTMAITYFVYARLFRKRRSERQTGKTAVFWFMTV